MSHGFLRPVGRCVCGGVLGLTLACRAEPPAVEAPRAAASPSAARSEGASATPPPYKQEYVFSEDWFTEQIGTWQRVLAPYRGRPHVEYLEVGLYEGRSALWMLEQILTDPSSRLTGVDLFPAPQVKERYLDNLRRSGRRSQATTITGYSQIELRKLPLAHYDIIYVDGSHRADDVMADAVLSWWLLKEGGLLIFDDYQWRGWSGGMARSRPPWPPELTPRLALDPFVTAFSNSLEVVHRGYQLIVRKVPSACGPEGDPCTVVGSHHRYWWHPRLLKTNRGEVMELTTEERALIEQLARAKTYGDVSVEVPAGLQSDPRLRELRRRINLGL